MILLRGELGEGPKRKTLNVLYSKCEKYTASVRGVGCRQHKVFNSKKHLEIGVFLLLFFSIGRSIISLLVGKNKNYMNLENPAVSSDEQYKKNFTEEERAGHLSLDEAQDKANMMRANMGVAERHTGRIWSSNERITREDYQKALNDIEEIEKLATEQTKGKEVLHRIEEIIQGGGQLLTGIFMGMGYSFANYFTPEEANKKINNMIDSFREARERNTFFNAKNELKNLIEKGDKFGSHEINIARGRANVEKLKNYLNPKKEDDNIGLRNWDENDTVSMRPIN